VTDRSSGDVTVLYNDATHSFTQTATFRAGMGPVYFTNVNETNDPVSDFRNESQAQPVAVVAAPFVTGGAPGVVVVDRGTHALYALSRPPGGGLTTPTAGLSAATSHPSAPTDPPGPVIADVPGQVVAADFNGDHQTDLAVLMQDLGQVWI